MPATNPLGERSSPVNQNRDYGLVLVSLKETKEQKTIVGPILLLDDRMLCDVIQKLGALREKPHYFSIILIIDTPKSIFFFFSTSITTIINRII
jgi:hypothetical protein